MLYDYFKWDTSYLILNHITLFRMVAIQQIFTSSFCEIEIIEAALSDCPLTIKKFGQFWHQILSETWQAQQLCYLGCAKFLPTILPWKFEKTFHEERPSNLVCVECINKRECSQLFIQIPNDLKLCKKNRLAQTFFIIEIHFNLLLSLHNKVFQTVASLASIFM